MHAKRTRDGKRIFTEEMEVMIRQLEEEDGILASHVEKMKGGAMAVSPDLGPVVCPLAPASAPLSALQDASSQPLQQHEPPQQQPSSSRGDFLNQIESLLAAATSFEKRPLSEINAISCAESDVTASTKIRNITVYVAKRRRRRTNISDRFLPWRWRREVERAWTVGGFGVA
jgi:hypothetical protein